MAVDYNELLYEKVQAEYDAFIEELKRMTPEQVIDRAYEKVTKENMLTIIREENLTPAEAKALNREKYPLDRMYQEWLHTDVSEMQMLKDSIDDTAKSKVPVAVIGYLESHPEIKRVFVHFDRDKAGREATEVLRLKLSDKYEVVDRPPDYGKDYNDFLCLKLGIYKSKERSFER